MSGAAGVEPSQPGTAAGPPAPPPAVVGPAVAFGQVLVDELVRNGLTDLCLAPGSRSAPLAMAALADGRVRVHVRLDERSASFLAVGLARGSGRPVAVLCTSGSAAANLHPAVVEADQGRVPLLVLTADRPPELRHTAANQTIDQIGLFGAGVRWFCEVGVPEDRPGVVVYWRSTACRAWAEASGAGGPAGPVHLNLALREPLVPGLGAPFAQPLDGRPDGRPWTATARSLRGLDPADLALLVERAGAARRGALVVGGTAAVPGPLLDLADHLGWPLLAEPHSSARRPGAVGMHDLLLRSTAFARSHRPDLVLTIGRVGLAKSLLGWLAGAPQIVVDPDASWLDPGRDVERIVAAEPAAVAAALRSALPGRTAGPWRDGWLAADAAVRAAVTAVIDEEDAASEPQVARDLAAALPDGAVLTVASSMPIRDLDLVLAPRAGVRILANRGASGIDGFVSTAIGVALAADGPAYALAGDLSLLHDQNGLLVAAGEPRPDLVMVVVNNDGGGIFSFLPQAQHPAAFERLFGTPHGVDLAAVAAVARCGHRRVEAAADLVPAVTAARAAGGLQLVEVRTDRQANLRVHQRIAAAAAAVLDAPA